MTALRAQAADSDSAGVFPVLSDNRFFATGDSPPDASRAWTRSTFWSAEVNSTGSVAVPSAFALTVHFVPSALANQ